MSAVAPVARSRPAVRATSRPAPIGGDWSPLPLEPVAPGVGATNLLAIDPGNTESGWVLINAHTRRPIRFGKTPNDDLRAWLLRPLDDFRTAGRAVIEMVASYGMAVGADVFETCVWIGRFLEAVPIENVELVKRLPVKLHHCHTARATDANIRQALVDRFAPGQPNHGKGTKGEPGWFYGFRADIWQAYALAVYAADSAEAS